MRVLICGTRHCKAAVKRKVEGLVNGFPRDTVVISGGGYGVDSAAIVAARKAGLAVVVRHAQWDVYGPAAGPRRNAQMIEEDKPDVVYAFPAEVGSKGTWDTVRRAQEAKIPVIVEKV